MDTQETILLNLVANFFHNFDQNDNWVDPLEKYLQDDNGFSLCKATHKEKNDSWFIVAVLLNGERKAVYSTCEQYPVDSPNRYTID